MISSRQVILACKEIPVIERYLISSAIENSCSIVSDQNKMVNGNLQLILTDGGNFTLELEYDENQNLSKLVEANSLDKIISNINFTNFLNT